jgi:hypothetical protein
MVSLSFRASRQTFVLKAAVNRRRVVLLNF